MYCSIGGAADQQRIEAVKAYMATAGGRTFIAVGYDDTGAGCRLRNQDCWPAIPRLKDWNEDWRDLKIKAGA